MKVIYLALTLSIFISSIGLDAFAFDDRFALSGRRAARFGYNNLVPCQVRRVVNPALGVYGIFSPFTRSRNTVSGRYIPNNRNYSPPVVQPATQSAYVSGFEPYNSQEVIQTQPQTQEAIVLYDPDYY